MSRGGRGRGRGRGDSKFPTFEGQIQFASAPPPLFPNYEMPPPPEINNEEEQFLDMCRDFQQRLKDSVYYLDEDESTTFFHQYSDRFRKKKLTKDIKTIPAENLSLFPEELHKIKDPTKRIVRKKIKKDITSKLFDALEKEEDKENKPDVNKLMVDEDDTIENNIVEDDEEDEEENDYIEDHYAEEDDIEDDMNDEDTYE
ncbi:hypothetical protein H8356DRAFT_1427322 [Neocallimastix lanati (nom. inval.)]|jgi:hypothetical protein|uniref:DNA-directed RNA polymerase III subunit n=1 Tax=Neocallimastix californiae TaxID=1754190 RepID=A0A1Y2F3G2_9FUNG|nr:hypothetical protein H8356DRAFT_1427322 [Neocallimastix sp. JGI-2020a]ORY77495.1 hypothetical protein LY90DRAFT_665274 [Neocallimastix californiae]|eukprot:ORY77495.1 hypothetical protein LY90DRAFT_665274 [Neocallimastix californiae]